MAMANEIKKNAMTRLISARLRKIKRLNIVLTIDFNWAGDCFDMDEC
jgi:hypothetical protein